MNANDYNLIVTNHLLSKHYHHNCGLIKRTYRK